MIRRYPLAAASFIVGILSFVHVFGLEKAVLAIILGGLAIQSIPQGEEKGKKYAYLGIILGTAYILILLGIMIYKGPSILELIGK